LSFTDDAQTVIDTLDSVGKQGDVNGHDSAAEGISTGSSQEDVKAAYGEKNICSNYIRSYSYILGVFSLIYSLPGTLREDAWDSEWKMSAFADPNPA